MTLRPKARLAALGTGSWAPEVEELFGESNPLNILRTISHSPALLRPFLGWSAALAGQSQLSRRHSEVLALRAAWNCKSSYEWGHHAEYGESAGLSADEVGRIAVDNAPSDSAWSEADRALLAAADELHRRQEISEETWATLEAHFAPAQLVEIPLVVGQYTMLSMLAKSVGVELEGGLPALPKRSEA